MQLVAVIPAYRAACSVGSVVSDLRDRTRALGLDWPVVVVDDGSDDDTSQAAEAAGADVVRHAVNRGKGAALRTGFARAEALGATHALSVDADGQHPAEAALAVGRADGPTEALVVGVRDLARAGAPRANQRSNAFSNRVLSSFAGRALADTQCGLRRYPLAVTRALGAAADGFAFEAEVLLRAARRGLPIVEVPTTVLYPADRTTHFHVVRDPTRIVLRVLWTVATTRRAT